jgi:hypothetical protein
MPTVTLDTNILRAADELRTALEPLGFSFAVVTVTEREARGVRAHVAITSLTIMPETAVWNEGEYNIGLYPGEEDAKCVESALAIISGRAFPPPGKRDNLSTGERNQLRDAMILCAHARERRDIFVTNDERGFIKEGRRDRLEAALGVRIMTLSEFSDTFLRPKAAT